GRLTGEIEHDVDACGSEAGGELLGQRVGGGLVTRAGDDGLGERRGRRGEARARRLAVRLSAQARAASRGASALSLTRRKTNSTTSCRDRGPVDRKSTRLNSSHVKISYAVFCLKKKKPHRPA